MKKRKKVEMLFRPDSGMLSHVTVHKSFFALFRSTLSSTRLLMSSLGHVVCLVSVCNLFDSLFSFAASLYGLEINFSEAAARVLQPFSWFLGTSWEESERVSG